MMGTTRLLRIVTVAALLTIPVAGCTDEPATATTTTEITAATPQPFPITPEMEAELVASALERYCMAGCGRLTRYVRDEVFTESSLGGARRPMPAAVRAAIEAEAGPVRFVTDAEADALIGKDGFVDGGRGILLSVGPVERLAEDVVGVDIGGGTQVEAGHGGVLQFQWDGERWQPAEPEDTGIATPIWMA